MSSANHDRAAALSVQLAQAHDELRRRLARIRAGLGERRLTDDSLATHCLAFCSALTAHHHSEDAGMFAGLLDARPDLAPTVAKLVEDHGLIAGILARVADLADRAATAARARPGTRSAASSTGSPRSWSRTSGTRNERSAGPWTPGWPTTAGPPACSGSGRSPPADPVPA
ncbi:hemerythrin domain-containing protein [Catenulispora yoronensis]